jgi:hypothetical protein
MDWLGTKWDACINDVSYKTLTYSIYKVLMCISGVYLHLNKCISITEQLEAALGTFMSPSVPLSLATEREFGRIVHHLGRKFFHHLLR